MTDFIFRRVEKDPLVEKIITSLDEGYRKLGKDSGFAKKRSFAPSTLVYGHGKCPRYWHIAFDGAHFTFDDEPDAIANMKNGSDSHLRMQSAFLKAGILDQPYEEGTEYKELKIISDDPPIFGFMDLLFNIDGETYPGEIKTSKPEAFEWRKKNNKGSAYHVLQLLVYLKVLNKEKGFLIYENKENYDVIAIPVEMNEKNKEQIDKVFDWMRQVHGTYKNGQRAKRGFNRNNKICKSCPVAAACESLDVGNVKIGPLEFDL